MAKRNSQRAESAAQLVDDELTDARRHRRSSSSRGGDAPRSAIALPDAAATVAAAAAGGGRKSNAAKQPNAVELNRLIHERMRLGIVSALAVNQSLSFNELKELMQTTDGNLSIHARKLEDAGYVVCTKTFDGRIPKTEYKLTAAGRRALEHYINHMEALIRMTREG